MKALRSLRVGYKKILNYLKADPEKRSVLCQKRDELNSKIDERGNTHDMSKTHGYSVKRWRCYGKQDWGVKSKRNVG
ncbi:hypothetical protein [Holospora curviuscula]|uniref:hypothetical protein n=1 Tax=Holospora curviuscula TaxID=1082868 RepID=UPI000CE57D44|nr:hypothetical protein [Holospora curviuscula]